MTTQKRAQKGGEYGKNGEWYNGGSFIANTDHPKGQPKPKKLAKREVAPYKWEVQPEHGYNAIFSFVGGVWGKYNHETGKMSVFLQDAPEDIKQLIEDFNNGAVWCFCQDGKWQSA